MARCVLAFDTSTELTCVALTRAGRVLAESSAPSAERHAQTLLPRVEHCLREAGLGLADVDLFVVGVGPGSFTGVRVGLATAKGFALATGKPLCGVQSLAVLARPLLAQQALVAPLLDGHKGEVFAGLYGCAAQGRAEVLLPPFNAAPLTAAERVLQAAAGRPLRVLGAGLRRYLLELEPRLAGPTIELCDARFDVPSARELAAEGEQLFEAHGPADLVRLCPVYLRDSDARLPSAPLRL